MLKLRAYTQDTKPDEFVSTFSRLPIELRDSQYHLGLPPEALWGFFVKSAYPKPKEFWIVEQEGRPVARAGATLSITRPGVGYFGFFEVDTKLTNVLEVTSLLDQASMTWFKSQGATQVYGPMNFSTWFQHRLRVNKDQDPRVFYFEPHHPPEYVGYFHELGYVNCGYWKSQGLKDPARLFEHAKRAFDQTTALGWKYVSFSDLDFERELMPKLFELSLQTFSQNFLYEPIDYTSFLSLYGHMKGKKDMEYATAIISPEGKFAGFGLFLVDQDHLILKSAAIDSAYQGLGLSNAMIIHAKEKAHGLFTHFAGVMFKSDNRSASYTRHGDLLWEHTYELYSKSLTLLA